MQLLEFQAKEVFKEYGIAVPSGRVCRTVEETVRNYGEVGGKVAIKAQVLAGGRGLAGGVKFAGDPAEVRSVAEQLFGMTIGGEKPRALLLEEKVQPFRELYAGVTWDYPNKCPVLIASSRGGMKIESVAREHSGEIASAEIHPLEGFSSFQARKLAARIGLTGDEVVEYARFLGALWEVFATRDAELAEINPLAVLQDSSLIALDAKLNIDDKSARRQEGFIEGIQKTQIAPTESLEQRRLEARKSGIPTYIEMEGNIGVIVDGAGSGMLTLDLVSDCGGRTRVYSEMGGEITPKLMESTLMTTLRVQGVTSVLVNLIGGLNRMDEMAVGISSYVTKHFNQIPIIVRMCGTKQEEGREILTKNGIEFFDALDEAVEKTVSFSKGV